VLTNILYIGLVLFIFITANRSYFAVHNVDYSNKGEYWLTVFMGIFYIIGAVLVSAIGYITVRNYAKRSQHTLNKK
jgi:positive regulator of sigma E activity